MSKAPGSPPRSRSRSYSRSRTRSRSRSRKHRYSSRSRSRSRSHSPSHGRNYPTRDYQNNRGFRGYNRGFRRPYYYRGRTRGYYPRGRYQRGGGNYGYRANNWQGGGNWHHHDQDHHPHSPRRGRSRSRTPRKRSASRSRSRYSDRSSSGRSRRSRHSSYSSRSSSPARRSRAGKHASKEAKDKFPEAPGEGPGAGGPGAGGPGGDASHQEKPSGGKWKGVREYDASPKHAGSQSRPAAGDKQVPPEGSNSGGANSKGANSGGANSGGANSKGANSGGALWRTVSSPPPSKSPPQTGTAAFGGFGFFSKDDAKPAGDKTAISSAFKKFLAESQGKKQVCEREAGEDGEHSSSDEQEAETGPPAALYSSLAALPDPKEDSSLPFFDVEEEQFLRSQGLKDREAESDPTKPKAPLTARDIFGKWEDEGPYYKEKSRREVEEVEEDLEHMENELYRSRKLSKKEEKAKKKEKKEKEKRSPTLSPVVPRGVDSRERDKPLFPSAREESPARRPSGKREDFELKVNSFDEMPSFSGVLKDGRVPRDLLPSKRDQEFRSIFEHLQQAQLRRSPSELFAQHIVTIVHYIKAQHFRSSGMTLSERFAMYQRKAAETEMMKPRRSPEIHRRIDVSPSAFKRHSQLFEEMEETSYKDQSKKPKGDVMDLRLDIERRKRFSAKEYKQEGDKGSGGSHGPSPEKSSDKAAKHHKKSKKSKKRRERSPSSSSSSSPSPPFRGKSFMAEGMEHMEGFSKHRFSPRDYPGPSGPLERGPGPRGPGDRGPGDRGPGDRGPGDRGPMDRSPRDYEMDRGRGRGFFPRVRGRGWSRGGYPGNNSSNGQAPPASAPVRPPEEEWDPEYTPKSRKYYFHDDREGEKSWLEGRGRGRGAFPRSRGRFVYRKGGSSPKWTHDLYQAPEAGAGEEDGPEAQLKPQDSDSKL
ncbi:thyroid hormone receptor-associated protein 3b isoform X2 [Osmerus eperlanus]|uniref:thyroid hormone receptor-associated protein 3b isoform X2 n=1 Tax=Osmerus eperlanus TaxID=29151 RepID=UPI002E12A6B7